MWVDDPTFNLSYHLRRTALPAPGGDAELAALMGRVMSTRLDRRRPLWEYWLAEGIREGRWALISKVHHCMVDGVSGTDLYGVVLDPTPRPRPGVPDDWRPEPEPSGLRVAIAAGALALKPVSQARALVLAARRPAELAEAMRDTVRGLAALSTAAWPAHPSSLTGPRSAAQRFAFSRGSVADVSTVRRAFGGTFNDVVLAARPDAVAEPPPQRTTPARPAPGSQPRCFPVSQHVLRHAPCTVVVVR